MSTNCKTRKLLSMKVLLDFPSHGTFHSSLQNMSKWHLYNILKHTYFVGVEGGSCFSTLSYHSLVNRLYWAVYISFKRSLRSFCLSNTVFHCFELFITHSHRLLHNNPRYTFIAWVHKKFINFSSYNAGVCDNTCAIWFLSRSTPSTYQTEPF